MFVYEKTLLCLYDKMADIIEGMEGEFLKKALKSYYDYTPVDKQAEILLELTEKKKDLEFTKECISRAISSLKAEERRILEEKYGIGGKKITDVINRNYYRKLAVAVGKFSKNLRAEGVDAEFFDMIKKEFAFIEEEYEKCNNIVRRSYNIVLYNKGKSLKSHSPSSSSIVPSTVFEGLKSR